MPSPDPHPYAEPVLAWNGWKLNHEGVDACVSPPMSLPTGTALNATHDFASSSSKFGIMRGDNVVVDKTGPQDPKPLLISNTPKDESHVTDSRNFKYYLRPSESVNLALKDRESLASQVTSEPEAQDPSSSSGGTSSMVVPLCAFDVEQGADVTSAASATPTTTSDNEHVNGVTDNKGKLRENVGRITNETEKNSSESISEEWVEVTSEDMDFSKGD